MVKKRMKTDKLLMDIPEFLKRQAGEPPTIIETNEVKPQPKTEEKPVIKEVEQIEKPKRPSIQERMRSNFIGWMCDLDDIYEPIWALGKPLGKFDAYKFYRDQEIGGNYMKMFIADAELRRKEMQIALESVSIAEKDRNQEQQDHAEAFGNYSKPELKKFITFWDKVITDAEKWENFCKANRKPRKVKPPTPEKIVKKLRYMPEHKSWGVKSINPVEILESKVLVAINATTRKLMVFVCDNLHGIKVNGNQISNWDLERSTMKTLADPQTTLKEISEKQGWRQMLNIIDALPGKKYEPIPKFHKNIILLKAIKQYG